MSVELADDEAQKLLASFHRCSQGNNELLEAPTLTALHHAACNTPLIRVEPDLYLKDETGNPAGCKLRGALASLRHANPGDLIVTASSGNTGIAVTLAARAIGAQSEVWMTEGVSDPKLRKLQDARATVVIRGENFSDTAEQAEGSAHARGAVFVSPGKSPDFVQGLRATFREIGCQLGSAPLTVYVPTGGGGLLSAGILERQGGAMGGALIVAIQAFSSRPLYDVFHGINHAHKPRYRAGYAECISGDLERDAIIRRLVDAVDDVQLVTKRELVLAERYLREKLAVRAELGGLAGLAKALHARRQGAVGPAVALLTGPVV